MKSPALVDLDLERVRRALPGWTVERKPSGLIARGAAKIGPTDADELIRLARVMS